LRTEPRCDNTEGGRGIRAQIYKDALAISPEQPAGIILEGSSKRRRSWGCEIAFQSVSVEGEDADEMGENSVSSGLRREKRRVPEEDEEGRGQERVAQESKA